MNGQQNIKKIKLEMSLRPTRQGQHKVEVVPIHTGKV